MIAELSLVLLSTLACRIFYVIFFGRSNFPNASARTLIVIGSGGHTSEMTKQIMNLNPTLYQPRLYVLAESDSMSCEKIKSLESGYSRFGDTKSCIQTIPRSRNVGQSYITSVFSTLRSLVACVPLVYSFKPDLILCNGPGTCIPICLVGFLMKVFFLAKTRIVFIESICRVKSLSLSGKILYPFADKILVQWPTLKKIYPKTEYIGRLV